MANPHILSAFDRDLESVQALVMRMGGLVEAALLDAAEALDTRDEDLAMRVRAGDAAVDALEDQINEECARLLALRGPTAGDLRTVLTVMKIAASLERAGDYAKNLAKRTCGSEPDAAGAGHDRVDPAAGQGGGADAGRRAGRLYPPRRQAGRGCAAPRPRHRPDVQLDLP